MCVCVSVSLFCVGKCFSFDELSRILVCTFSLARFSRSYTRFVLSLSSFLSISREWLFSAVCFRYKNDWFSHRFFFLFTCLIWHVFFFVLFVDFCLTFAGEVLNARRRRVRRATRARLSIPPAHVPAFFGISSLDFLLIKSNFSECSFGRVWKCECVLFVCVCERVGIFNSGREKTHR